MSTIESVENYLNNVGKSFPYDYNTAKKLLEESSERLSIILSQLNELDMIILQNSNLVKQNLTSAVEQMPDSVSESLDALDLCPVCSRPPG